MWFVLSIQSSMNWGMNAHQKLPSEKITHINTIILINLRLVPFEYFQNMDKPVRISKIEFMPGK